ncbi:MAG TPA: pitrilysin family protein [Planctomycetota bacterium]|nr:pitrilysin family protein [Planctomycetota bacterium]
MTIQIGTRTLPNGLRVAYEHDDSMNSFALGFLVHTGGRDETKDVDGVSHFLEHMCFKGSTRRNYEQVNLDFDRIGSEYNAFTSEEATFYYIFAVRTEQESALDQMADLLRPALRLEDFTMEKNVILEEIAMYLDHIEMTARDRMMINAYKGAPLATNVIGTRDSIKALTRDQMQAYYDKRYVARNITFVVSGNFDLDAILKSLETRTAAWPAGEPAVRRKPSPFKITTGRDVTVSKRFQKQAVAIAFPAPPADKKHEHIEFSGSIAAAVLGGANSRLYWNLVRKGLALSASSDLQSFTDSGMFLVYAICMPEKLAEVEKLLREEIAKFQDGGVTDEELFKAKNRWKTAFVRAAESPFSRLYQAAMDLNTLGEIRSTEQSLQELNSITIADTRKYLNAWPLTGEGYTVYAGPADVA